MTVPAKSATRARRTLVVRADDVRSFSELAPERDEVLCVTLVGSEAETGEAWGFEAGALGRSHGLIERLGEVIDESGVELVVVPDWEDASSPDERAAIRAAVAAASVRDVEVALQRDAEPIPAQAAQARLSAAARARSSADERTATAVISAWNKRDDVRANLLGLRAQTRPFDDVVVVDNRSTDGTPEMIREEFPEVRLVVMPNSAYGACETFNVGFASALTDFVAILDDDVVLTPWWLERTLDRFAEEPDSTAVVSTKVVEPGMPDSYRDSEAVNRERYMSTFRGCASLARKKALDEAGGYDERLFIYGNERDLTCRLLNLGYRVLQFPGAETFHRTPFGVQMGKRSLYYHARNAWLGMLKYAPAKDLAKMPYLVLTKVLLRGSGAEEKGEVSDAVGTIGIGKAVRQTKGSWWILTKAGCSVLYNVPYCLKHRKPVKAEDFELPLR
ncbi:MAG: glycosyltransferase [Planctomycetota bacterium]